MTLTFDDVTYTRDSGGTRVNAAGLIVGVDFSVSSVTFGTGPQTFTLAADANVNRDWPVGSLVRATSQASPLGLMNGTVTSYDPATQELVIEVTESTGTGTATNWRIGSLEFRRDFDPVTLAPRGGLVEGGATNVLLRSQDFENAYWNKVGGSIEAEKIISPDGSANADVFLPTAGSAIHRIDRGSVVPTGTTRTNIFFLKNLGCRYVTLGASNTSSANAAFDLDDLLVIQPTSDVVGSSYIYDAGNGWRICVYQTAAGSTINVLPTAVFARAGAASSVDLAGTERLGIWGGMVITGLIDRISYIPTTTVSVSRAADLLAVDGANFTQAYNQSQGTLLVECIPTDSVTSSAIASINDGTLDNEIRVGQKQSGTRSSIRAIATDGVTDLMGLNAAPNNVLIGNGVDLRETTNSTGTGAVALAVASNEPSKFLTAGALDSIRGTIDSGDSFAERGISSNLNGAHFGIGRFVIGTGTLATGGGVIVSTDGLSFRRINIAGLTQTLNEVTSNGVDQYVAVGNGGVIYTSSDAENWVPQTSGTTNALNSVHFFGGRYVAATSGTGASRYSDNGITWTSIAGINLSAQDVYHNGTDLWVAVGNGGIIHSSPDGITWTARTSGVAATLTGVHFADGLWVAVGVLGTVVTSPDGITWTDRTATSGTTQQITEVNFFNGKFYYVGLLQTVGENTAAGIVAGTTWTLRAANVTSTLIGIATNGSRLLICGSAGAIATSDNGINFTPRTGNNATLNGAAFGNGTYVVVGNAVNGSGLIATVDPVTFAYQRRVSGVNGTFGSVRFLNGAFYATVSLTVVRTILRSVDGITWSTITAAGVTSEGYRDITLGNGIYVSVGSGGSIATSSDGLSFSRFVSGATTQTLEGVSFANNLFVAVGNAGTIITSPDGTTWTLRTSGTTANLFAVHYSTRDQQWYAAGDNGTILRSADAITWTSIANDAVGAVVTNGEVSVNPIAAKIIPNKRNRIALSWSSDGASLSVNGSVASLDPSLVMPIVDRITIGRSGDSSNFLNAPFKVLQTYKAKVSDTELQAITRI